MRPGDSQQFPFFRAGLALAFLLRFLVRRLVGGLDRIIPGHRVKSSLRRLGMERSAADVIGGVVYWIVLIFFLTASRSAGSSQIMIRCFWTAFAMAAGWSIPLFISNKISCAIRLSSLKENTILCLRPYCLLK